MFETEASFCAVEGPGSIEVTVFRLFASEGSESTQSRTCLFFQLSAFVDSRSTGAFRLAVAFAVTSLPDVLLGSKNPMPPGFV